MAFFLEPDERDWDFVLGVNLRGVFACTHAVLPGMQDRRRGSIVNIASEAGRTGVRCNAVSPRPIETPMLSSAAADYGRAGEKVKQMMIDATAMGRIGLPEEVAASVAFLASAESAYITGHTLAVSGGLVMA